MNPNSNTAAAPAARDAEAALIADIAGFSRDPLGFVLYAFPWRSAGTALAERDGPDDWQRDILRAVGEGLMTAGEAIQVAVASGHGIGKSALVAWLLLWSLSTHEDTRGVVTANTDSQLRTKTWAELAKWHRLCLCKHWFTLSATALYAAQAGHEKTWRIDMVPWSERNTEAFAGLHNQGKRIVVVFDEASAIPDQIWETTEGALTDSNTEILWLAFGNPTRNSGRFRECFGRFKHRWRHRQIDSRSVRITNKKQIAQWVADYGEDSDFVRVRVKGQFPRAGSMQFIGSDLITAAIQTEARSFAHDALVIGVDVARFGDDQSVIYARKGRDARTFPPIKLRNVDTMTLAGRVAEEARRLKADAVFVDEGGVGAGVVDRLRQLNVNVIGVQFGAKADGLSPTDAVERYANKRAEMYGNLRQALKAGLALPDDQELIADLTNIDYGFNARDEIQLEKKEEMKKRGLASPDLADALALTYAYPAMAGAGAGRHLGGGGGGRLVSEWDPFG
ncbi:terminase [Dongia soli]|uniref:Terminase n=1 Tax=Dongia soli TaxID=600628 RepID=A0ABU5EE90_9PROT|nr:terminase [Dongia soli]MDY0884683.1 terminase [Dongia soli]